MGVNATLLRLLAGAGLLAFGYYLGRQVGRMEPIREELARARGAADSGLSDRSETPRDDQTAA